MPPAEARPLSPPSNAVTAARIAWATAVTAAAGAGASAALPLGEPARAAAFAVLAAGTGWAALLAASLRLPRGVRGGYVADLASTMAAGVVPLLPVTCAAPWMSAAAWAVAMAVSVAASFVLMLRMQRESVRRLGLSVAWVRGWAAALWSGAAAVLAVCRAVP